MAEVFKIQNVSTNTIELIDFGLIIPSNEIVELGNFDMTILSSQLNTYLSNGSIVRLIDDASVPYSQAYSTTIQIYQFDSSSVDASINQLYIENISQDASIILKADKTYVDSSISVFATNASIGLAGFINSSALNPYATNSSIGTAAFAKNASLGLYATNASIGLAGFINSSALNSYATNASVGIALQPYATNSSVGLAIAPFATNVSIGLAGFATNSSVGLAIAPFATNASVGLALNPYATNSSIGLAGFINSSALNPYATNASIGLAGFTTNTSVGLALGAYATNSSIGTAAFAKNASLGLYATNASIGLAGFAKQTYVDSSLNAKVNQTLFDSSIAFQTNWNTTQEVSLNNRVKKTGDTMTGDLILSGTGAFIRRDNSTNRIALYGGTGESDGAYFQVTGSGYTASPGGRSAEFVIGELSDSKYTLFSYDGISTWTPRFTLTGSSGLVSINNDISIGGSLRVTNCSSIGDNLPYAQIDISNGNKLIHKGNYYGQEFQYNQDLTTTTTTQVTPNYTTKCSITTPTSLPAGKYKITASYGMNKNVTNSDLLSRIQVDGTTLGNVHNHELSDGTTWLYASRSMAIVLTAGSHTINLQFSQEANGTLSMRDGYLEIIRVS